MLSLSHWPLTAAQLAAALGAAVYGPVVDDGPSLVEFAFDSRRLGAQTAGVLFACLRGQRDGHAFAPHAAQQGVRAFLVERFLQDLPPDAVQLLVPDTLATLQQLAAARRRLFTCPVLALTGSNGKTTVKEWLASLLESWGLVGKSPGSYNSQLGVALALLHVPTDARLLLIEAGISQLGEMARLAELIQPTHGILTHFGDAHDEGFPDRMAKLREKLRLFVGVERLWCTADDPMLGDRLAGLPVRGVGRTADPATGWRLQAVELPAGGWQIELHTAGRRFEARLPVGGAAALENAALALAVALDLGAHPVDVARAAERLQPVSMRLTLITDNPEISLLNDAYNADVHSVRHALAYLAQNGDHPRRVVILSDLEHQGHRLPALQRELLAEALDRFGAGQVLGVGPVSAALQAELPGLRAWPDVPRLLADLQAEDLRFSTVLLKGARRFALEQLVPYLTLRPHAATLRVDLEALGYNFRRLQQRLPASAQVVAMLKAEAYGSGAWPLAQELTALGAAALMVASTAEALELRRRGIGGPIWVQSPDVRALTLLAVHELEPVVADWPLLEALSQLEYPPRLHLELDTGMGRLGFLPEEVSELADWLAARRLEVATVFTHFGSADDPAADGRTHAQAARFEAAWQVLAHRLPAGLRRHACNSAGALRFPEYAYDYVRTGLLLYGLADGQDCLPDAVPWANVLQLEAPVLRVRELPAGSWVGYGAGGQLVRPARIATLGIGYADGLPRSAGWGRWCVRLNGQLCPTVGSICMDLTMVDASEAHPVAGGDVAVVVGEPPQGWAELARVAGTIPYELICHLGKRLSRHYGRDR